MRIDRSKRTPPSPIIPRAADRERKSFLDAIAAGLQRRYRNQARIIMTGGGAFALRPDSTRITGDLDLDTDTRIPALDAIRAIAEKTRWGKIVDIDQKQRGRGYIRVRTKPTHDQIWETKIDIRTLANDQAQALTSADLEQFETRAGTIRTYSLKRLASIKAEKLQRRDEGRDFYDNAWLISRHPELYTREQRLGVCTSLTAKLKKDEVCLNRLAEDRVLKNADPTTLYVEIADIVQNDPEMVLKELAGSQIAIERDDARQLNTIVATTGEQTAVLAANLTDAETTTWLDRYGLKDGSRSIEVEQPEGEQRSPSTDRLDITRMADQAFDTAQRASLHQTMKHDRGPDGRE